MRTTPFYKRPRCQIALCFCHRFLYKPGVCENKTAPSGTIGTEWILPVKRSSHDDAPILSCRVHRRPDRWQMEDRALVVSLSRYATFLRPSTGRSRHYAESAHASAAGYGKQGPPDADSISGGPAESRIPNHPAWFDAQTYRGCHAFLGNRTPSQKQ